MSCSKKDCANRPRAEMLDSAALLNLGEMGINVISRLLLAAKTGIVDMAHFQDAPTQALAAEIMRLWKQAQTIKWVETAELRFEKTVTGPRIAFGPDKNYVLMIPAAKIDSATAGPDAVRKIAEKLNLPLPDNQLPLPFDK